MIATSVSLRSARSPDELAKLISALRVWIKGLKGSHSLAAVALESFLDPALQAFSTHGSREEAHGLSQERVAARCRLKRSRPWQLRSSLPRKRREKESQFLARQECCWANKP